MEEIKVPSQSKGGWFDKQMYLCMYVRSRLYFFHTCYTIPALLLCIALLLLVLASPGWRLDELPVQ